MSRRKKSKEPITAGELMARLETDPEYQSRRAEQERQQLQQAAENITAAEPVLADLRNAGFHVDWISDLHNQRLNYQSAIPILLYWVSRIENKDVKASIIGALGVKWAKPAAAPTLIQEFKKAPDDFHLKWAIGNALSVVADDGVFEEIVGLVRDRAHGRAREMLAVALGNMRNPHAIDVLIDLLSDEELAGHALIALGRLKAKKARAHIEPFLHHEKAWVRQEAKRALAKIDRMK